VTDSATGFNLADTVQAGIGFLTKSGVDFVKKVGPISLVAAAAFTALGIISGTFGDRAMLKSMASNEFSFDYVVSFITGLFLAFLSIAFTAYLVVSAYRMASGAPETPYVWKLGSAEPPLIGVRKEESVMIGAIIRRIWSFWPLLVAGICFGISNVLDMQSQVSSFASTYGSYERSDGSAAGFFASVFGLVGWFFIVWTLWNVTRRFLFLVPVIVETGTADKELAAAPIEGSFPTGIAKPMFLKCAALMLIAYLPIWLVGWLVESFFESADNDTRFARNSYDPFVNGLLQVIDVATMIVAAAFFAGALAALWPKVRDKVMLPGRGKLAPQVEPGTDPDAAA